MISFKILTEESREQTLSYVLSRLSEAEKEYIIEIAESLLSDDEAEYALSACFGCLLIRIFDGEYSFSYPVAVCDNADETSASLAIRDYAVKEEIPLVFSDVPRDELGGLVTMFRHANIDAEDATGDTYRVRLITEAAAIGEIPTVELDAITLDALRPEDDAEYARLCRDGETNRFWGYDYSLDAPGDEDSYFRESAEGELSRGVAMSFAVRSEGKFVGEAALYAFNYMGECDCAIRILPEYRQCGIAGRVLLGLIEFLPQIGLVRLRARVMRENEPSKKLCAAQMENVGEAQGGILEFAREL